MSAVEAAEKNNRAANLQAELEALFTTQNRSTSSYLTSIPATFLRVTVSPLKNAQIKLIRVQAPRRG